MAAQKVLMTAGNLVVCWAALMVDQMDRNWVDRLADVMVALMDEQMAEC